MTTEPRAADSTNDLLRKWCRSVGSVVPRQADSNNVLLRKILEGLRAQSSDGQGGDTGIIPPGVGDPVVTAEFSAAYTGSSTPLTVNFTNLSTGNFLSYAWDFGDGGSSSSTNPTHIYTVPGTYTVTLTTTGAGGSAIETKVDYIVVGVTSFLYVKSDAGVTSSAGLVSQWDDQSGNFRSLSQSTEAFKPLIIGNQLNGYPSVRFVGDDDEMPSATFPAIQALTFAVVLRLPSQGQRTVFSTATDFYFGQTPNNEWFIANTSVIKSASSVDTSATLITGTVAITGAAVLRKRGTQILSGNVGSVSFTQFILSGLPFANLGHDMEVFSFKLWNTLLPGSELSAEESYLISKYGL